MALEGSGREGCLMSVLFLVCLCVVNSWAGSNICNQDKLVPATSMYNISHLQSNCEDIGFTRTVCESARNGFTSFDDLYLVQSTIHCCDGLYMQGGTCASCPRGRYGHNCSLVCQCLNGGSCDGVTGECTCLDGWTGSICEERCSSSTYGPNCSLPCLQTCLNDGVCHPSSGHCLCDFGWDGLTCNTSCAVTACSVQSDMCSNGATYDPTGFCACKPGWQGRYCTEPCPSGKHGPYCKQTCRCEHGGLCDGEDGTCRCPPGYTGRSCESSCDDGLYGPGCELPCECLDIAPCDHVDGACRECPIGYNGTGCTKPCSAESWGPTCIGQCECIDQTHCDRFTGACSQDLSVTSPALDENPTIKSHDTIPKETVGGRPPTFNTTSVSFLAPVIGCIILIIVVLVLAVVLVVKHPCSNRPAIRPEEAAKLNHQYAGHIIGKGECDDLAKNESDYAEIDDIDFGYEDPQTVALDALGSDTKRSTIPNYYQTPTSTAPSSAQTMYMKMESNPRNIATPKSDSNGYLLLDESRKSPSDYQKINKPTGGFFSQ